MQEINKGKEWGEDKDAGCFKLFESVGIWSNTIYKIQAQQGIGAAGYFSLIKMLLVLNIFPGIGIH